MKKINKYDNGGDPPVKQPDYLQYKGPNYFMEGNPIYDLETYQKAITRDSTALADAFFPSWMFEEMKRLQLNRQLRNKKKPYTEAEIRDLNLIGKQYTGPAVDMDMFMQQYMERGIDDKAYGGKAIPKAGFGNMFKTLGQQIKTGLAGAVQGATGGILPATRLLRPELRQEYADEMKMGSLFGGALGMLGGAGLFKGASLAGIGGGASPSLLQSGQNILGGGALSSSGLNFAPNTFNAIYGSGINPAMMNPSLAGQASAGFGFNNLFNMGSNFGIGNNPGLGAANDILSFYQQGQEGMQNMAMGGRAGKMPTFEEFYYSQPGFSGMETLGEFFNRLAIESAEKKKKKFGMDDVFMYNQGGKATNMKQDMGQDINVESGELLMSNIGGRFQSMNPKAPIKEVMPGVSMVQGNQSNDNVPIKIPDGETKVFSKRLGYADKGLELVQKYKDLEATPDSDDFIGQQTKKFELSKIRKQLEELFQEQERAKSKQIAKRTKNVSGTDIPQAGLGLGVFLKTVALPAAKKFLAKEGVKQAGNFLMQNAGNLYNLGVGAFGKDPQTFNIDDYVPDYNPDPKLTKINTKNILGPMYDELASSRYAINRSGGTPEEIIQGNMLLNAKGLNKIGAAESKAEALQRNLDLGVYDTGFKAAVNKGLQGLNLAGINEQRLGQRNEFFKEGIQGLQNYFTGRRNEDFIGDIYNQRYGNLPGSQLGTGNTNFDMQYGFGQYNPNMPAPSFNPSSFTGDNLFSGFTLGN
tara:strand:+ start:9024 stop:11279 length:2256 start_codon:yes stop_codon:yes gene_type:complete